MGMTFNQLALVRAVSENNLSKAKAAALACCAEDTTQKNKEMVSRYAHILKSGSMNMIELPTNIKNFSTMEELSLTYNENRYYLAEDDTISECNAVIWRERSWKDNLFQIHCL